MKRKNFIIFSATAGILSYCSSIFPFKKYFTESTQIIKPQRLKTGDTVGLISPAGFIKDDELKESIKNIEALGFKVFVGEHVLDKFGYFAGADKDRASDVNKMFTNKKVKGIFCTRGGYGCSRILPLLDYNTIKENPKPLIGYSDITALIYGIFSQTGLVCFNGPVGISSYNDFSVQIFNDVLMNPKNKLTLTSAKEEENKIEYNINIIRAGYAEGQLIGGNLSVVTSLIGTPYDVDTKGKIIFLEEMEEEPYRIDRMLTQMIQAGKFEKAAGVALGVFVKCEPSPDKIESLNSFSFSEVLHERLFNLGIPVIYGLSFGHTINKFTLPCGIKAGLDTNSKTITLLENAVE